LKNKKEEGRRGGGPILIYIGRHSAGDLESGLGRGKVVWGCGELGIV